MWSHRWTSTDTLYRKELTWRCVPLIQDRRLMRSCESRYCCSISNGSGWGTYCLVSLHAMELYTVKGKLTNRLDDAIEACRTTALDMHSHCEFLSYLHCVGWCWRLDKETSLAGLAVSLFHSICEDWWKLMLDYCQDSTLWVVFLVSLWPFELMSSFARLLDLSDSRHMSYHYTLHCIISKWMDDISSNHVNWIEALHVILLQHC